MFRHARSLALFLLSCWAASAFAAPPAPGKRGRSTPPPHAVSRDNLARAQARLASGALAPRKTLADSTRLVALRIEFPDLEFGASPPADELHDRFYYQTHFGYASQYFAAASASRLDLRIDVPDTVATGAHPQATYGDFAAYDSLMVLLASEAIAAADPVVDFSLYEGVLLVHAGPGQESDLAGNSPEQIWSGFLDDGTVREALSTPDSVVEGIATDDGVLVRSFAVLPEWEVQDLEVTGGTRLGSLGVYAHEIGQSLGMIPLFDGSPGSFPDSQGLGNFDVMAYGLWVANGFIPSLPSAFNRVLMGWVQPIEVDAGGTTVLLRDHERGPVDSVVARVRISDREYFLVSYIVEDPDGPVTKICSGEPVGPRRFFEFEDKNANCVFDYEDLNGDGVMSDGDLIDTYAGAEWDFFMTDFQGGGTAGQGYGLLVVHVDEQVLQEVLARGSTNVQGDAQRKAVDVEEADGIQDLDRIPDNVRSFGSGDDYFVSTRQFGPTTIPDTRSNGGVPTGIRIFQQTLPGDDPPPGERMRVRILREPASASAPRLAARRAFDGAIGADLVALPLADGRRGLVVPADSGQVLLLDANLDEAPVSDGDPATLRSWVTVPPELAGRWVGAAAVGDVDGDGSPDAVLCADADSAGAPVGRLFAWRRDGTEVRDLDADPLTNTGLLASFPGRTSSAVVFDADGDARSEIYVVREDSAAGFTQARRYRYEGSIWTEAASDLDTGRRTGGPIVVRWGAERALAWTDGRFVRFTTFPGTSVVYPLPELPSAKAPIRLVSGNLDAAGADEMVVVSQDGVVSIVTLDAATLLAVGASLPVTDRLAASFVSPLALADLDADGTLEILLATDSAMHVLSATGAERRGWPYPFQFEPELEREPAPGRGAGSPLAADLDGDGAVEIALHLPGGAWLVWDTSARRRRDLESALPARGGPTPLVAQLDTSPGLDLSALGSFPVSRRYLAGPDSLITAMRTELVVWKLPQAGAIRWGEWGGGPGHAFFDEQVRNVQPSPNDPTLAGFVVGPNPAGEELRARVELTAPARVRCRLFTLEGEVVRDEARDGLPGTIVEIPIDLRGLASGTYLAQLDLSTGGRRTRPVAVRR